MNVSLGRTGTPFPRLLALGNAAILRASPAAAATLRRRYGVGYLLIDRLHGAASPSPARIARVVYTNPAVTVLRLR